MEKSSFVLYTEYKEQCEMLPREEVGNLLMAIFEYVETGEEIELSPFTKMLFISIRNQIDRDSAKYREKSTNGKKGGAPKGNQNARRNAVVEDDMQNNQKQPSLNENNQKQPSLNENKLNDNEDVNVDVDDNVDVDVKKENPKKKSGAKAPVYFDNPKLDETFKDFIEMRKRIKKPMTERAINLMIGKIERLNDNDRAIQCLEDSIMNDWQGIYPDKEVVNNGRSSPEKPDYSKFLVEGMDY